jgi:hypothetical protein
MSEWQAQLEADLEDAETRYETLKLLVEDIEQAIAEEITAQNGDGRGFLIGALVAIRDCKRSLSGAAELNDG